MRTSLALLAGAALWTSGVRDSASAPTGSDLDDAGADLSVAISDDLATVKPGSGVRYEVVISNHGPVAADGAVVSVPEAVGLAKTRVTCAVEIGDAECPRPAALTIDALERDGLRIPALPAGSRVILTIAADVTATDGTVTSEALIDPPPDRIDPRRGNDRSVDTDAIAALADLHVTISDGLGAARPGGRAAYTIHVSNNGPDDADGALVASPDVPSLERGSLDCSSAGGAACPTELDLAQLAGDGLRIPALPAGSSVTLIVSATWTNVEAAVTSEALVVVPEGAIDPFPVDNRATDRTSLLRMLDLRVTATDGVDTLNRGTETTYSILVSNNGASDADGALVSTPANGKLARTRVTCAVTRGDARCPIDPSVADLEGGGMAIPRLGPGAAIELLVTALVRGTEDVITEALVTGPEDTEDLNPDDNHAIDADRVSGVADLWLTGSDGVDVVKTGRTTSYEVALTNRGPDPAGGTVITVPVADGLDKIEVACRATGGATCPEDVSTAALEGAGVALPSLPADSAVTFTITSRVTATSGSVLAVANAALPRGVFDPTPRDNHTEDRNTASRTADLRVAYFDRKVAVRPRDEIAYTLEVTNAGPVDADGALLVVPPTDGLTRTEVTCEAERDAICPAELDIASLERGVSLPRLPASGRVRLTIGATVSGDAGSLASAASIKAPAETDDPSARNNHAEDLDEIATSTDLSVQLASSLTEAHTGDELSSEITVTNQGTETATHAILRMQAVNGLERKSLTCIAEGGATCPENLTIDLLQGEGVRIPWLPAGAKITLTCGGTVTGKKGSLRTDATLKPGRYSSDPTTANNRASASIPIVKPRS